MQIDYEQYHDVYVLKPKGNLQRGTVSELLDYIGDKMSWGVTKFVIDFSATPKVDDTATSQLIKFKATAENCGSTLKLCSVKINDTRVLMHLCRAFEVYKEYAAAVRSF